jgi:prepilin-type N-terminal cleavage/methylation domain-containing protein
MRNSNKGFTQAELLVVVVIIGILIAIAIPAFNGILGRARLSAATSTLSRWFNSTRLDSIGEAIPETLCIKQSATVEISQISGTDCEDVENWQSLPSGVQIDLTNSTLRTVKAVAGNKGSIYRASWAETKAGSGGSYGQLGKLVLMADGTSDRSCVVLAKVQGDWDIRYNYDCLKKK